MNRGRSCREHRFTTHEVRRNQQGEAVYDKWLCSRCGREKT